MYATNNSIAYLILCPDLALASTYSSPYFLALIIASSVDTCLYPSKSDFVAISILQTSPGAFASIWCIHLQIFQKEFRSTIEKARIIPAAPLQQVWVIFLNLYWPAVSQICNLYLLSSTEIVLILKSTPMVATQESLKVFSQKRVIKLVLPTPESPMMMTLAKKSNLPFLLASYIYSITFIIFKLNKMDNQPLQLSPPTIKQTQSILTNINHSLQQSQLKYGNFPNPRNYSLNQSLFNLKQLTSQPTYAIISQSDYLYFGGIYNQMKHGLGVQLTKDTVYQGQFSLDYKTGKGYQKFPNGAIYFGDFLNNRTHGQGSLKFGDEYYIGDFENGSMEGDGMWRNKQGDKYIGEWKANKAHGYGIYITKVSHYQGFVNKFVKHGQGVQQFANGDYYKGMYQDGHPHGFGEYVWKDGSTYKGDFFKGLRHGAGIWTNQNGDQYEGQFKKDKKNGKGTFIWANGNLYKGQFCNEKREGQGEMSWNDGSHYKGDWKNGNPNGLGAYKKKGQSAKSGIFQNNKLVREFKPQDHSKNAAFQQPLVLSMVPQLSRKRSNLNTTFRTRDMKTKGTSDTSNLGWSSYKR